MANVLGAGSESLLIERRQKLRQIYSKQYAPGEAEDVVRKRIGQPSRQHALHVYGCLLHLGLYPLALTLYTLVCFVRCFALTSHGLRNSFRAWCTCSRKPLKDVTRVKAFLIVFCYPFDLLCACLFCVVGSLLENCSYFLCLFLHVLVAPGDLCLILLRPMLSEQVCRMCAHWMRPSVGFFACCARYGGYNAAMLAYIFLGALPANYPLDATVGIPSACIVADLAEGKGAGVKAALVLVPGYYTSVFGVGRSLDRDGTASVFLNLSKQPPRVRNPWNDAPNVVIAWGVIFADGELVDAWVEDAIAEVQVTVKAVSGDTLVGPKRHRSTMSIRALKANLQEDVGPQGSLTLLADGDVEEIADEKTLLQFMPGPISFTLVRSV